MHLGTDEEVPGWDDASLRATFAENRGLGLDADLPDVTRFARAVTQVIARRLAQTGVPTESYPAVFFLAPNGPPRAAESPMRVEMMLNNGITPIEGCFWFVGPIVIRGSAIDLTEWPSDTAIFKLATDELGLGALPAVWLETRSSPPSARFYPRGLGEPEIVSDLRLSSRSITVAEVLDVVENVYQQRLVTPSAQLPEMKLWKNKAKHWVARQAEKRVQSYLVLQLSGAFPTCEVRPEETRALGRVDILIDEPDYSQENRTIHHAVVELKVLRSFGSTGSTYPEQATKAHVRDGVVQAAAYRDDRRATFAALCCFDMRNSFSAERCFAHVRRLAQKHSITLRVWHLFASAGSAREHRVA